MVTCAPDCQMIVGTAVTGFTLLCVLGVVCCAFWFQCQLQEVPVTVVQENPVRVAVVSVIEEDPQPLQPVLHVAN
jgi:hypothetical protein